MGQMWDKVGKRGGGGEMAGGTRQSFSLKC